MLNLGGVNSNIGPSTNGRLRRLAGVSEPDFGEREPAAEILSAAKDLATNSAE